jgi:hypothetical protein
MLKTMRTISSRYRGSRCRIARVSKLCEAEQKSELGARECECEMLVGLGKIWVKVAEDAGAFVEWKAR